ncbi:MAG: hypothetical protein K1Y01_11035 [Vicinamibacteria bacterium]|nr:hypothetical protein [Vicinamibacteria bacterium]
MTRPSAKEWSAALALFTLLTVAMTWPFAARLRIIDAGDSAYFTWAVGWQIHAIKTDPASLPHGNFYAPSRFTFFMDEPVLGTGLLVLPLSWLTDDAILLFNVARLLTWVLTGLFTWRLARDLGLAGPAALATGAFFAFSPIRVDQVSHLSTLGTQWIPLVYLFARRFCLEPTVMDAVRTGLFFALSFLACGYHGLFFAILLPLSLLPFLATPRFGQIVWKGLVAVGAAAFFLYPLYALSREALGPLGFARSGADTLKYAASLETFLAANRWNRAWGGLTENLRGDPSNLFPGLVVVLLAGLALARIHGRIPAAARRFVVTLAVLGFAAALLALGPEIRWRGAVLSPGPFALLRDHVPVFSNIRATGRAGIFVAFALALLAGAALQPVRRPAAASGLALVLFLLEARIAPIPTPSWTNVIDSSRPAPRVYAWLQEQPKGTIVAELPARPAGDFGRPAFHDSIYMVWSTLHWQPLVNGFAGAETPLVQRFRATAPSFPEPEALDVLKEAGTRYVVVHLRGYGPNQRERLEARVAEMGGRIREVARFVNGDRAEVDTDVVYELLAG